MPKITAWKCPHSGRLFEDHGEYKRHLATLSRLRCRAREHQILVDSVDAVIAGEQKCQNGQELVEYILANSKEYLIKGMWRSSNGGALNEAFKKGHQIHWPKLTGMKLFDVRWNDSQSNSHCAPRGKDTNWGGNKRDIPRGYPGWHGNLRVWYKRDARVIIVDPKKTRVRDYSIPSFSDCVSHNSGIYCGSGGGRDDGWYCDFTMFAEDYPEMEKQVTFHILAGRVTKDARWNSPSFPVLDEIGEGRSGYIKDGDPF